MLALARRPLAAVALTGLLAVPTALAGGPLALASDPAVPGASVSAAAASTTAWPLLRRGSSGVDVRTAQHLLRHMNTVASPVGDSGVLVVDGRFGPATHRAVVEFQRRYGLRPDGVVGPVTWRALVQTLGLGSRGESVVALQVQLRALGYDLYPDGWYGRRTLAAVRQLQGAGGLRVDGIAGPATWRLVLSRTR